MGVNLMQRICVFCGSNSGRSPEYLTAAATLGRLLAQRRIALVYGGSNVGLMGTLADSVLEAGGYAIGVIPRSLVDREVALLGLQDLRTVETMHERKALMADLADGFIAMPGGYGTFDELFEIVTWAQLGIHAKPIGLLDVREYFATLMALVEHAAKEGFVPPAHTALLLRA